MTAQCDYIYSIQTALEDFLRVSILAEYKLSQDELELQVLPPPHTANALPKGKMAVYGFAYNGEWLKIGMAGSKSSARFHSQHYNPKSARSTLAASLIKDEVFWSSIPHSDDEVGQWLKSEVFRFNILVNAEHPKELIKLLEAFLHLRLKPRYEG